jgi:hypothetical protein
MCSACRRPSYNRYGGFKDKSGGSHGSRPPSRTRLRWGSTREIRTSSTRVSSLPTMPMTLRARLSRCFATSICGSQRVSALGEHSPSISPTKLVTERLLAGSSRLGRWRCRSASGQRSAGNIKPRRSLLPLARNTCVASYWSGIHSWAGVLRRVGVIDSFNFFQYPHNFVNFLLIEIQIRHARAISKFGGGRKEFSERFCTP